MDQRKQLAQRLYITPNNRQRKMLSYSLRADSLDRRQPRSLKPRILPALPVKQELPQQVREKDWTISYSKRPESKRRDKGSYVHGELVYPPLTGVGHRRANPFDLIELLKYDKVLTDDFWYLNRGDEAYDFRFVPYDKRNPDSYVTVSARGVTYFVNGTTDFLTLDEWEREYQLYNGIMGIPFFKTYKKWKYLALWKKLRRKNMLKKRAELLKNRLFYLNEMLREPILQMRTQIYRLVKADLIDFSADSPRDLPKFLEDQSTRREKLNELMNEVQKNILNEISTACNNSMERYFNENRTRLYMENQEEDDEERPFLIGDTSNKDMPFAQEAVIKSHYTKLTKFIWMCDHQIIDARQAMCFNSTVKILEGLKYYEDLSKKYTNPVFLVECNFEVFQITYDPSPAEIKNIVIESLKEGYGLACSHKMLVSYAELQKFVTQISSEPSSYVEPSYLFSMIVNEPQIRELGKVICQKVDTSFSRVETFSDVYTPSLEIYNENEQMDVDLFRTAELQTFRTAIDTYKSQISQFGAIKELNNIGIYQLKCTPLKEKLKPNPRACLNKLRVLMPQLSFERAETLHQELNGDNKKLMSAPTNVDEYITFSKSLRKVRETMNNYTERFSNIKQLNDIMDDYYISYDDEVKQKFSESLQSLTLLRQKVQVAGDREEGDRIRFSKELSNKIVALDKSLKEAVEKLKDDKLSDREAQPGMVVLLLKEIGESVETAYTDSKDFEIFQEELELEKTNFDHVSDIRSDFQLKSNMWNALYEWGYKLQEWNSQPFKDIDVESIGKQVDAYFRVALRSKVLEDQGNFVPDVLKNRVETLKDTMPVVVDLRSPALLPRHWDQIQEVLEQPIDISQPSFTLKTLIDMEVKNKKEEIAEIALKAKKEMELEKQLTDTTKPWETLEFTLKFNKDKDVFLLAQLEELIGQLDESSSAISSIASNRFVGPLYSKVEPWQKDLALFSSTLEEWMAVQKGWLYLENIFSSPDIAKQLPGEQKRFALVDTNFKRIMREVAERPLALPFATKPKLLKELHEYNTKIEVIQKALEEYLDKKRKNFPRFYFLSNDELLEILAQARIPANIQHHFRKFFENIYSLEFGDNKEDILAMISAENERLSASRNLKARGVVEDWLRAVEADMVKSLKREMREGFHSYEDMHRPDWVIGHLAQVVSCVGNIMWTFSTEEALSNKEEAEEALADWYDTNLSQLEDLTRQVRTDLTDIKRRSVVALVTQDVHNRDIIEKLRNEKVNHVGDFRWQQQLRYYFTNENEECSIRQVNAVLLYGYEYMGATSRLVITPLTDRCWMTITGALHLKLGASPAGPAGTGKTESVKDLAKAVGQYCIVFNCSEQITFMMMEKLFLGLASTGSWSCLDEFNRIDIEVLSVIAQQLRVIRNARWEGKTEFFLDEKHSQLIDTMGVFITMNPGYAGRTELPDNLKVLFRPMSMMVPDYTLIAEIMLFAEGFSEAKRLSGKMTKLYKLSSEQLSQQDHYDFGMRAVKSVLNMAGSLKRKDPDLLEEVILIRAMRDSNVPKFLKEDLVLFYAIVQDLFPGAEVPFIDYGELQASIKSTIKEEGLQPEKKFIEKVIQLFETFAVRFGVMIVGPATSGKTTCYKTLATSLTALREKRQSRNPAFQRIEYKVLNPKAIGMGELYGEYNEVTQDWKDGLASSIIRSYAEDNSAHHKWVVFDGPVDSLWIENMNTVLDDNMMLCLANGQRIKLKHSMRILFEVQDLAVASPATVSRCGMVYLDIEAVGWKAYMVSWIETTLSHWPDDYRHSLRVLFEKYIEKAITTIRKGLNEPIPTLNISLVMSCANLVHTLAEPRINDAPEDFKRLLDKIFMFSLIWGIGGALDATSTKRFESTMTGEFQIDLPKGSLYDSMVDTSKPGGEYVLWDKVVPSFNYDSSLSYFEMVVPTKDTVRFSYLVRMNIDSKKPVFLTGSTGVGKTVIVSDLLLSMKENDNVFPVFLTFSAQTSSNQCQSSILSKMDMKRKDVASGPGTKRAVILIDDVNMPAVEIFGAQPPIELMRQYCDGGFIYDRTKHFPLYIKDTSLICCTAPPGGGRNSLSMRFTRHFHMLCIPPTSEDSMMLIFKTILDGFFKDFKNEVQALSEMIVRATINVYHTISAELLPTPAKSHYSFNLRDVSKVFQGILMSDHRIVGTPDSMIQLWVHESSRIFHDRLITNEDKVWFNQLVSKLVVSVLRKDLSYEELFGETPVIFADFLKGDLESEDRYYDQATSMKKLTDVVYRIQEAFNYTSGQTKMELVFFRDALQHLCRICRVLRQPRGNAMLVGVSGCGKQSLTRLASFINNTTTFQLQIRKVYGLQEFREDLKILFKQTGGAKIEPTVFLLTDSQILRESFLEDINNILNSGEVPNLFTKEELEEIEGDLRPMAGKMSDNLYGFFIQRVRENLHLVLCMSPVGEQLRVRMRMFPSLINCCTIDWVDPWPEDALLSVGMSRLTDLEVEPEIKEKISHLCVNVHSSVFSTANDFLESLGRHVYISPKTYLDMIQLYYKIFRQKSLEVSDLRQKYSMGVATIQKTNEDVKVMQEELTALAPIIEQKKIEADELSIIVERESQEANIVKQQVEAEEKQVSEQAAEVQALQKDAQTDLDQALPVLEAATKALDMINPRDIAEIRTFQAPAPLIRYTLEAVSILLQEKSDWDAIKRTLQNNFIERLKNYPRDSIPKGVLSKIRKKIAENPDFTSEKVGNVNQASKSLCLWVFAIDKYAKVSEEVAPKRERLDQMNQMLREATAKLKEAQDKLQKELDNVAALEAKRQAVIDEQERLDAEAKTTAARLGRASVLTESLAEENLRWQAQVETLGEKVKHIPGDSFLASACIGYYGPFTGAFRNSLVSSWINKAEALEISLSPNFDLVSVMGDPMTVREWNIKTLPADSVSISNGILVTSTDRVPLMIDPQEQANRWIRRMEERSAFKAVKQTEKDFGKTVEAAVRNGVVLLVEDVGETLESVMEPLLEKNYIVQGPNSFAVRMGDQEIDLDPLFNLYITTKLSNPHYLPEVTIKTAVINFTVTAEGLEEQLLGEVIKRELPAVERKKGELMVAMARDQKSLIQTEDNILSSLTQSSGNILDDPDIIETLKASKELSVEIGKRMLVAEENNKEVKAAFAQYESVAVRGRILYFVVTDLANIDPMYQYSLNYFSKLFISVIENAAKSSDVQTRIQTLIDASTEFIFINVCRGLFNSHKLIFSFLIASQILRNRGDIADPEWNLLLRGVTIMPSEYTRIENPDSSVFSEKAWDFATVLENILFPGLARQIASDLQSWTNWLSLKEPQDAPIPGFESASAFHRLLIIKGFREEKVIYVVSRLVEETLGRKYIEIPPIEMEAVFEDTSSKTPVIFVLSPGADPMAMLYRLADALGTTEKMDIISLGKGQGERAKKCIENAVGMGRWVVLQNCHLARSWMTDLENIAAELEDPNNHIHEEFRLFLSSLPCDYFPVPVLQNGVKITNEPPKGIRANLLRSLNAVTEEEFENNSKPTEWKKLIVALSFFHANVQERRKFGALGWNIRYEFNDSDLETSQLMLRNFLNENAEGVPWEAIKFMTGEINYGGRVTDDLDRRCLISLLNVFICPEVLQDDYKFSVSGKYYIPPIAPLSTYKEYVESLPLIEEPEVFGMHDNANIAFQIQESSLILSTALAIQPRETGKKGAESPDAIVDALAASIYEQLPTPMLRSEASETTFARDKNGLMSSLSTFLGQEMVRFNKLIAKMKSSLEELRKAIKGIVAMSVELDQMYQAMLKNQVPPNWTKVAYPSLKLLSSWFNDLKERIGFIRKWLSSGVPEAYWLSSFFFPQGFLTAVLQSFARKYQIPIDTLDFSFDFQPFVDTSEIQDVPEDGCFLYGLFIEGCRWDMESMQLQDSRAGEIYTMAPVIYFEPSENYTADPEEYRMPVYKTSQRAGSLSTTGHSTNFIIGIDCPSTKKPQYWIMQGAAFLCQLND